MKVGILGSKNSILGFKAIGVDVLDFACLKDRQHLKNYGILFITEDCAKKMHKELDEISGQTLPAILTIPSLQGTSKEEMRSLKKIVKRAVGSDILQMQN